MPIILVMVLISAPLWAILCAFIGWSKGYEAAGWAFIGLVFGLFGVIAVAAVPTVDADSVDMPAHR